MAHADFIGVDEGRVEGEKAAGLGHWPELDDRRRLVGKGESATRLQCSNLALSVNVSHASGGGLATVAKVASASTGEVKQDVDSLACDGR